MTQLKVLLCVATMMLQASASRDMGVITGHIRSLKGEPASGVRVFALEIPTPGVFMLSESIASLTETDINGSYRLENIPAGRYYIGIGRLDTPTYHPGVPLKSTATILTVGAATIINGMDFSFTPTSFSVSGSVIWERNGSLPQAEVFLIVEGQPLTNSGPLTGRIAAPKATVDADGRFSFQKIRPEQYMLLLQRASGNLPVTTSPIGDSFPVFPQKLNVTDKNLVVDLRVPKTQNYSGVVSNQGGGPVPRFGLSFVGPVIADVSAAGTFRAALPPGSYVLTPTGLPPGFQLKSVESAGVTTTGRSALRVTLPDSPSEITVTLDVSSPPPWVRVAGQVTGTVASTRDITVLLTEILPRGIPTSGAFVISNAVPETWVAPLEADGTFEFRRVLSGSYTAELKARVPGTQLGESMPPLTVNVGNRNVLDLRFAVQPVTKPIGQDRPPNLVQ